MNTQSLVNWTYALHDAQGYSLERSMNLGSAWAQILSCSNATTSYYDDDLTWHDYPWYRVTALNAWGGGPHSLTAKLFINSPGIDRPQLTGSQVWPHATQSFLEWNYTGSVQGSTDLFQLERSFDTSSGWSMAWVVDPTGSSFIDDPAPLNVPIWYRIKPHCDFGLYGPYSNIVMVLMTDWPAVPMPDWITAFQYPDFTPSSSISWSYTGSTEEAMGFVLERAWRSSPDQPFTFANYVTFSGLGTTNYQDTAVTWSREFSYKMYAYSGSDPSIRRSTETYATTSFIQAFPPQLQVWQHGTTTSSVVFWNYLGQYTMSLSRSSDGGASWDLTTFISPTSGGYYFIDDPVVVGETYTYKVQEVFYPGQPESITASVTILPEDTSRISYGFMADAGFQYNDPGDTVWEHHTASLLEANYSARKNFKITQWLLGGDNGYQSNDFRGGYDGQMGRLIGPSQSLKPVIGNHDLSDMLIANYRNYFHTPNQTSPVSPFQTTDRYYTLKEGNVQVFYMETTADTGTALSQSSNQWYWFSGSLSASMADPNIVWRIAMVHVPGITSLGSGHTGNPYLRALPWKDWGVDIVLSGHVHWLERMESASVCFLNNSLMGSDKRSPMPTSSYTKWWYAGGVDDDDYVWTLLEFTQNSLTMSHYSGSVLIPDTGSTELLNAKMENGQFILMKPWFAPPTMSSVSQVGGDEALAISWTFDGDFTQSLYRSSDGGLTWPTTYSIDPGVRNYTDSTVTYFTEYFYKVRQMRWSTEPYSDVMSAIPIPPVPVSCASSSFADQLFTSSLDMALEFDMIAPPT